MPGRILRPQPRRCMGNKRSRSDRRQPLPSGRAPRQHVFPDYCAARCQSVRRDCKSCADRWPANSAVQLQSVGIGEVLLHILEAPVAPTASPATEEDHRGQVRSRSPANNCVAPMKEIFTSTRESADRFKCIIVTEANFRIISNAAVIFRSWFPDSRFASRFEAESHAVRTEIVDVSAVISGPRSRSSPRLP